MSFNYNFDDNDDDDDDKEDNDDKDNNEQCSLSTDLPDGSSPRRSGGGEVGGKPGNLDQLKT